jgi:hypothetical protein
MGAIRAISLIFELRQNAIVIDRVSLNQGQPRTWATKVGDVSALSGHRPAKHNQCNK